MAKRTDAVMRVISLAWTYTVGSLVAGIVLFVGLIWMIVDVVWQLITGTDGLSATSIPARWVQGVVMWFSGQTNYALTGSGDFELLPSPA